MACEPDHSAQLARERLDEEIFSWRDSRGLPTLSDVKKLSQEITSFMSERAKAVGKRVRVVMGDGEVVCDPA